MEAESTIRWVACLHKISEYNAHNTIGRVMDNRCVELCVKVRSRKFYHNFSSVSDGSCNRFANFYALIWFPFGLNDAIYYDAELFVAFPVFFHVILLNSLKIKRNIQYLISICIHKMGHYWMKVREG